ncbi:MAG TPA: hypothetical protein VGA03_04400 [Anaerolineales bacterium]
MPNKFFRFAWLGMLLVAVTVACNLFTGISEDVRGARDTAEAIATQARGLGDQAQGLATALGGGLETIQAFATEEAPGVLETGRALLTEAAEPGLLETAQAKITEDGSGMLATLEAIATQGFSTSEGPEDIPVVAEAYVSDFFASEVIVSYLSSLDYPSVLAFYKQEMPDNGWTEVAEESLETENAAVLKYEKDNRTATITLSGNAQDQQTAVQILVGNQ